MAMPNLLAERHFEFQSIAKGKEHIIGHEVVPRGSRLTYMSYDISLVGLDNMDEYNEYRVDLRAWWLPFYDNQTIPSTSALMKTEYDQRVPKVDDTSPYTSWTATDADEEMGDTDVSLIWRPDKISLSVLTNPASPAMLYKRRIRLGFLRGNGFRQTDGHSKYAVNLQGAVSRGINAMMDGLILWVLTLPPDVAENFTEFPNTLPAGNDYASLGFLAPLWDPVLAARTLGSGDFDAWRKWSIQYLIEDHSYQDISASGPHKPIALSLIH